MTLFALLLTTTLVQAQYSVSSFSGKVEVKHAGKVVPAANDMKLSAVDMLIIGEDASVDVFDSRESKIYTRSIPGEIGITSLIFEAKKSAKSRGTVLHRKLGMGKTSQEEGKMYVEKGKITLALEEYDPAGEEFMIDAKVMAQYIAAAINAGDLDNLPAFPTTIQEQNGPNGSLMFQIDNIVSEPLYINVIKLRTADSQRRLAISELGQPIGCYVLLPDQSIMRSQSKGTNEKDLHLVVATHYYFSIDELIAELEKVMAEPQQSTMQLNLPIYLHKI